MSDSDEIKIRIPLFGMQRSTHLEFEQVWADHRIDDLYQVWNLPAYAYNIEMADIVRCRQNPDQTLDVIEVIEKSGSVGVWLYFENGCTPEDINRSILELTKAGGKRPTFEKYSDDFWGISFRDQDHFQEVQPVLDALLGSMSLKYELVAQPDKPFGQAGVLK